MRTIESRLKLLEQRQAEATEPTITMYDGPAMTHAEIDEYNRTRRPDQPCIFTLRIDRAHGQADE